MIFLIVVRVKHIKFLFNCKYEESTDTGVYGNFIKGGRSPPADKVKISNER